MTFRFRPGINPEEQLKEIEKSFGLQNLNDVEIVEESGTHYLYLFTDTKKFKVALTQVS